MLHANWNFETISWEIKCVIRQIGKQTGCGVALDLFCSLDFGFPDKVHIPYHMWDLISLFQCLQTNSRMSVLCKGWITWSCHSLGNPVSNGDSRSSSFSLFVICTLTTVHKLYSVICCCFLRVYWDHYLGMVLVGLCIIGAVYYKRGQLQYVYYFPPCLSLDMILTFLSPANQLFEEWHLSAIPTDYWIVFWYNASERVHPFS